MRSHPIGRYPLLLSMLLIAGLALAQHPRQNVSPAHHPNLAAAQRLSACGHLVLCWPEASARSHSKRSDRRYARDRTYNARAIGSMRIRLLGTGTPTPSLKRMSAGYLVEVANRKILLDFGPGAYHRMMEAGVKAIEITDVFFTHLHYDHCLVGDEGIFAPDLKARTELPMSQAVFVARGGTLPRAKPRPIVREVTSGEVFDCGAFTVEARAVIHAQPILDCFGYRLEAEGRSVVYSGDAGPCEAMVQLARDCDVLVHMCHFLSGTALNREFEKRNTGHRELAQLGERARVRNLVVSHVTEQFDRPGMRERVIREMSEIYKGNIFFGDGGFMVVDQAGFQLYKSSVGNSISGDAARGAGAGRAEKYEKTMDEKAVEQNGIEPIHRDLDLIRRERLQ